MPIPASLARLLIALAAMFVQDLDTLHEVMPCRCCCRDHTYATCEARVWGGCRSGLPYGEG